MKKLFGKIENIVVLIALTVFGVLLIAVPQHLVKVVPYVMGGGLILYGIVNLVMIFKSGDRQYGNAGIGR